jgi:hypothetical protein
MTRYIICFALTAAWAQTTVQPKDIVNAEQVRINANDARPLTLVSRQQIADGRFILDYEITGIPLGSVCVWDFFGLSIDTIRLPNFKTVMCYTAGSLPSLRLDPNWKDWLLAHGK